MSIGPKPAAQASRSPVRFEHVLVAVRQRRSLPRHPPVEAASTAQTMAPRNPALIYGGDAPGSSSSGCLTVPPSNWRPRQIVCRRPPSLSMPIWRHAAHIQRRRRRDLNFRPSSGGRYGWARSIADRRCRSGYRFRTGGATLVMAEGPGVRRTSCSSLARLRAPAPKASHSISR
jgi:hypothetical protein